MKIISKRHPLAQDAPKPGNALPEGLYIQLQAVCRSCDRKFDYNGQAEDFDPDMAYCGRTFDCFP